MPRLPRPRLCCWIQPRCANAAPKRVTFVPLSISHVFFVILKEYLKNLFFSSKRNCHFFISPVTPVLECWRKVRVALGPGLIIRVTIKDPWLVFSGRFHRGPSRTREWVLSGGLHKRIITCTLYILSSHRKTCSSRKQSGVFCRIFLFWHLILFVGEHFRHLE